MGDLVQDYLCAGPRGLSHVVGVVFLSFGEMSPGLAEMEVLDASVLVDELGHA